MINLMDISKFLNVYANIPDKIKGQIVVVIDNKPMTWNAVHLEITEQSELGKRILEKLEKMGII